MDDYGYTDDTASDLLLELPEMLTEEKLAAVKCGWLDIVVIDGKWFGEDPYYTNKICKKQRDPLFFLNIADGLRRYNKKLNSWTDDCPDVFYRLASIRSKLEKDGIVLSQMSRSW